MIRVLHFSDVHVEEGFKGVSPRSFLNKRLLGYANLGLRRRALMAEAKDRIDALHAWAKPQHWDAVLCTGDYTALGTPPELAAARAAVEPLAQLAPKFITMPGNHDWYLPDSVKKGYFEAAFGEHLKTDWPEFALDGVWPQVHFFGDELCIIALNSARPNPEPFRSSGRISDAELAKFSELVEQARVRSKLVIVATHYAPRLANGRPDRPQHGLENAEELLEICSRLQRSVIAHGHVHWCYHVREVGLHVDMCCAGSLTHKDREGFWVYEVEGTSARAIPGYWTGTEFALREDGIVVV